MTHTKTKEIKRPKNKDYMPTDYLNGKYIDDIDKWADQAEARIKELNLVCGIALETSRQRGYKIKELEESQSKWQANWHRQKQKVNEVQGVANQQAKEIKELKEKIEELTNQLFVP